MAQDVKKDEVTRPTEAGESPQAKRDWRGASSEFSIRQDSLHIPKPAYHKHVDDGAELGEPVEFEGDESRDEEEQERAFEEAAAAKRARSKKIRWWGILLFILLYAVFKMMRYDQ